MECCFVLFLFYTHLNRHYLSHKGTQCLANPVTSREQSSKIGNLWQMKNNTCMCWWCDLWFLIYFGVRNPSPSSSERSICQRCSWTRLRCPLGSLQFSSSGSSECLLITIKQLNKHTWEAVMKCGTSKAIMLQYISLKKELVKHLQEPERSCLISSFSGMSWMAALIFSLISLTAFCHFKLQWRRSTSQSADTR